MEKSETENQHNLGPNTQHHHMSIAWQEYIGDDAKVPADYTSLKKRAGIIGRIGLMMLSCGTGAWRVRDSMDTIARVLGVTCSADIGLLSISYTCVEGEHSFSQTLSLPSTGVNTDKLEALERYVKKFEVKGASWSLEKITHDLDKINAKPGNYTSVQSGLASALACGAFTFLLGGGLFDIICAFVGAGFGQWLRKKLSGRKLTLLVSLIAAVSFACFMYFISFEAIQYFFNLHLKREAGYIGSMLFVIPGFPFITSGLDIFKSDMRSGLERLVHALTIIIVATVTGWLVALLLNFKPQNFAAQNLDAISLLLLRLVASFCGVYGFSVLFNSTKRVALTAGLVGAVANTLRLELVDFTSVPPAFAAFLGALVAGLLSFRLQSKYGYPRIALTVPAIVIMVPGLYLYRAIYNIGLTSIGVGSYWLTQALLIVLALPLGLAIARVLTDTKWRHCD
ncbi:threonine/serine exporter family protein [Ligilactobacillus equi]|uniref:threonine/serine ThrE exporter family protein n=1 Tax=Ligilactobacillus equi TaxID=137357 RepID=UPI002ED3CA63